MPASQELVKLIAYFTEDDEDGVMLDAENLWAEPVDANPGGGTYRLTNVGLFIPFAPGDVVRAQINGHSRLAVVGVESLSDRCVVNFLYDEARIRFRVDIINVMNDRNYVDYNNSPDDNVRDAASPSVYRERSTYSIGGNPPRTIKLSAGFSF